MWRLFLQKIQFRKARKEGGEIDFMDFKSVKTRMGSSATATNDDYQSSFVGTNGRKSGNGVG